MAFEELSENLLEQLLITKSRIQESRLVNSFNEKFSSLSTRMQTVVIIFFCVLVGFLILLYPLNKYKNSLTFESSFEKRKDLTKNIISYAKKRSSQSLDPKRFNPSSFQSEFADLSQKASLLDSQYSISPGMGKKSKFLPRGAEEINFKVSTTQLNLTQAINVAYGIKNLSDSILLDGISVKASSKRAGQSLGLDEDVSGNYFDVDYFVSNFYVKPEAELMPKAKISDRPQGRRNNRGRK